MVKKVLLVRNCNIDGPHIKEILESKYLVNVFNIKTIAESVDLLEKEKFDLIMVNRICSKDLRNGLDLIKYVKKNKIKIPIMFIYLLQNSIISVHKSLNILLTII